MFNVWLLKVTFRYLLSFRLRNTADRNRKKTFLPEHGYSSLRRFYLNATSFNRKQLTFVVYGYSISGKLKVCRYESVHWSINLQHYPNDSMTFKIFFYIIWHQNKYKLYILKHIFSLTVAICYTPSGNQAIPVMSPLYILCFQAHRADVAHLHRSC